MCMLTIKIHIRVLQIETCNTVILYNKHSCQAIPFASCRAVLKNVGAETTPITKQHCKSSKTPHFALLMKSDKISREPQKTSFFKNVFYKRMKISCSNQQGSRVPAALIKLDQPKLRHKSGLMLSAFILGLYKVSSLGYHPSDLSHRQHHFFFSIAFLLCNATKCKGRVKAE